MKRYKAVIITQLKEIVMKKAPIFVNTVLDMSEHARNVESKTMEDFQILLQARQSLAISPFRLSKGNEKLEEMEEINLEFISEKSSDDSSMERDKIRKA